MLISLNRALMRMADDERVSIFDEQPAAHAESLRQHIESRGAELCFSARDHFQQAVSAEPKIVKTLNAEVVAISGGQMVEKAQIKHKDGRSEEIATAGVFAYIGLEPNADFLPEAVKRDANGFVVTNGNLETALPGVWAVGAVRGGCGGLLDDATTDGKKAAQAIRTRLA